MYFRMAYLDGPFRSCEESGGRATTTRLMLVSSRRFLFSVNLRTLFIKVKASVTIRQTRVRLDMTST